MSSKVIQGRVWAILALKTIMLILRDMGQRNKNWSIFDIWYSSVCSIEETNFRFDLTPSSRVIRGQRLVLIPFCLAWIYIPERLSGHYGVCRLSVRSSVRLCKLLVNSISAEPYEMYWFNYHYWFQLEKNHWWHYQRLNPAAGRWNHNLLVINAEIHCHVTRRDWSLRTALYEIRAIFVEMLLLLQNCIVQCWGFVTIVL